jgi:hypothetical protein
MIATEQHFAVNLVRGNNRELIILIWLDAVTTAVVSMLSEARVQLGLIRQAES